MNHSRLRVTNLKKRKIKQTEKRQQSKLKNQLTPSSMTLNLLEGVSRCWGLHTSWRIKSGGRPWELWTYTKQSGVKTNQTTYNKRHLSHPAQPFTPAVLQWLKNIQFSDPQHREAYYNPNFRDGFEEID